jgi:hypothetical protein
MDITKMSRVIASILLLGLFLGSEPMSKEASATGTADIRAEAQKLVEELQSGKIDAGTFQTRMLEIQARLQEVAPGARQQLEQNQREREQMEKAQPEQQFAGTVKEYTADMVNVTTGKVMQKIAVTPDKIYSESLNDKGKREGLAIVRLDQKKMYMVMEDEKSYIEVPFNKDTFSVADLSMGMANVKREKVGTETVSGYTADKFQITASAMGMAVASFEWVAPEFDPMPVRTESQGQIQEMRNIKTGRPDASLFEVPAGYKRDAQMEQMMKGMMGGDMSNMLKGMGK